MLSLAEHIETLAKRANWQNVKHDADGAWYFKLEHDLSFMIFSPSDRLCICRAEIIDLPETDKEKEDLTADILRSSAGICRERSSTIAIEQPNSGLFTANDKAKVILHRIFHLPLEQADFDLELSDFLNDLAWWKAALNKGATPNRSASPFSMGNFFNGVNF